MRAGLGYRQSRASLSAAARRPPHRSHRTAMEPPAAPPPRLPSLAEVLAGTAPDYSFMPPPFPGAPFGFPPAPVPPPVPAPLHAQLFLPPFAPHGSSFLSRPASFGGLTVRLRVSVWNGAFDVAVEAWEGAGKVWGRTLVAGKKWGEAWVQLTAGMAITTAHRVDLASFMPGAPVQIDFLAWTTKPSGPYNNPALPFPHPYVPLPAPAPKPSQTPKLAPLRTGPHHPSSAPTASPMPPISIASPAIRPGASASPSPDTSTTKVAIPAAPAKDAGKATLACERCARIGGECDRSPADPECTRCVRKGVDCVGPPLPARKRGKPARKREAEEEEGTEASEGGEGSPASQRGSGRGRGRGRRRGGAQKKEGLLVTGLGKVEIVPLGEVDGEEAEGGKTAPSAGQGEGGEGEGEQYEGGGAVRSLRRSSRRG
ncbi:hypothetical protein DFJ74DRAFT_720440 [Hyaloraphidium curvatum]|nr:hypothetical protein DFJ74DRAFT_720440 [Hyaloraphidium curvatum]